MSSSSKTSVSARSQQQSKPRSASVAVSCSSYAADVSGMREDLAKLPLESSGVTLAHSTVLADLIQRATRCLEMCQSVNRVVKIQSLWRAYLTRKKLRVLLGVPPNTSKTKCRVLVICFHISLSLPSPQLSTPLAKAKAQKLKERNMRFWELYKSELTFRNTVLEIKNSFLLPLKKSMLLNPTDLNSIFGPLEAVCYN